MANLKPCPYRHADEEGHILCDKIKSGDREVSPNVCRACPVFATNCSHLRATLSHHARPPITVRWGNGRTEVWEEDAPSISLLRAACATKVTPILSPRECTGCSLRQALATPTVDVTPPRAGRLTATPFPAAQVVQPEPIASATPPVPTAEARSNIVAQKIIQLQEWLAKQRHLPPNEQPDGDRVKPLAAAACPAYSVREEKRVGWTD